jgi:hypothetical protein
LQSFKFEHTRWFCSMDSKSLANKTWDPIQCYPNGAKVCKSLNISIFSKLNSIFWHSKTFQTRAGSLQKGYPLHQSYKKIKNACPWKPFHPFKSWFIRRISQSMPFGFPKKTRNAQFSHRDPSPRANNCRQDSFRPLSGPILLMTVVDRHWVLVFLGLAKSVIQIEITKMKWCPE